MLVRDRKRGCALAECVSVPWWCGSDGFAWLGISFQLLVQSWFTLCTLGLKLCAKMRMWDRFCRIAVGG